MKKISLMLFALTLLVLLSGCSGGTAPAATTAPAAEAAPQALAGVTFEAEKFSVTVPEGWESMAVDGGVQLYKMSGEIIEVHFRGENQTDDSAKQQAESNASAYSGTTPAEVTLLGKTFWATTFTAAGVEQTSYLRIENGVLLSIKCAKGNYETTPEYAAIIDSIVFK
ncbi:MAG: hypothetical protein ABIG45_06900 [Bacillota bacterium]